MKNTEIREAITLTNENQKIFGILHLPAVQKRVPAVLICSGFAGNKCGKYRVFVRLAEELTRQGIAVFRFDYRGSGDSEGSFNQITIDGKVSDTLCSLKFLESHPNIDRKRIGLLGRSLGGAISILTANRHPGIKSVVLWAPVFSAAPWKSLWDSYQSNNLSGEQKVAIQNLPGGIPNITFLEQFFKINMEEELTSLNSIPMLHIEGALDKVVTERHGLSYKRNRQTNSSTKFLTLPHSDHDFSNFEDQKIALDETCDWFKKTL